MKLIDEKENKKDSKNPKKHGKDKPGGKGRPDFKKQEDEPVEEGLRLIVRVSNVDLNGKHSIVRALTKIKGIGIRMAKNIGVAYEKETGKSMYEKLGKVTDVEAKKIEEIAQNILKFGIPAWSVNRKKDIETGENRHVLMSELDFSLRQDIQRLMEIKTYRGLRHSWGLPVRGQRTKSTHRGKGGVVGVTKKDVIKAAAPAAAATGKEAPAKGSKR